ncbi:F0F1 ATP synthase subunit delta [Campylobacter sp. 19-13652]|uniref:F0F1 ATP synthase subunit delta n=1 Tax=Campylobacter sp. 19-13652 TaxID=2840180 RepID=UPI001C749795|nr:F0F1 ATP synthase subunit delta [Campylobacter sp. 19-13652]BCX78944.1 hypothetical protein LBC_04060 [Campylobacter sp. 19-13652]
MSLAISKKYVKAIIASSDDAELEVLSSCLLDLAGCFKSQKLKNIISFPGVKPEEKVGFLLSLIDCKNDKVKNLINLLAQNKRLGLIPEIAKSLLDQISAKKGEYIGNVYTQKSLSEAELNDLAKKFSQHFKSDIKLSGATDKFNGAKVELDGLGVEVSFSVDRFKSQLSEYILKAI